MTTKICTTCKQEKKAWEFCRSTKAYDGLNPQCKECVYANKSETELAKMRKKMPTNHRSYKNVWHI